MRRLLSFILFLCIAIASMANSKFSTSTKRYLHQHESAMKKAPARNHEVQRVNAFITLENGDVSALKALGVTINSRFGDNLVTVQIPINMMESVAALPEVKRINTGEEIILDTDSTLSQTDANIAHASTEHGVSTTYDGRGVVIGIIDQGFDFNHRAFKDADGNTRIKRVYMPNYNGGTKVVIDGETLPGSEFTTATSIAKLTTDYSLSHGTHCLGIAAGSQVGKYGGMAPGADIIICAMGWQYDVTTIANCANYIVECANKMGKRCVITMSLGTANGPHDGTSDICKVWENTSKKNAIICLSNGNLKIGKKQYMHTMLDKGACDGTMVYCPTDTMISNSFFDIWSRSADTVGVRFQIIDPTQDKIIYNSPIFRGDTVMTMGPSHLEDSTYVAALSPYMDGSIHFSTATGNNGHFNINCGFEIKPLNDGPRYRLGLQFYDAEFDAWMSGTCEMRSNNSIDGYNYGAGSEEGNFNDSSTGEGTISVGNYAAKTAITMRDGSTKGDVYARLGDIYTSSAYGYNVKGNAYPFVSAPGCMVISAINRYHKSATTAANSCDSLYDASTGKTDYWGPLTGTSMAAPTVAGAIALWLQANPNLTFEQIREIIKTTAFTDEFTAAKPLQFGCGKINACGGLTDIQYSLNSLLYNSHYPAGREYCIADASLRCIHISRDRTLLYCKDNNEAPDKTAVRRNTIDFIHESGLMPAETAYDQSNWIMVKLPVALPNYQCTAFQGSSLLGLRGTLVSKTEPLFTIGEEMPDPDFANTNPPLNIVLPANYYGEKQQVDDKNYYFYQPKHFEIDTLKFAMWDGNDSVFTMPDYTVMTDMPEFDGTVKTDFTFFEDSICQLENGTTYDLLVCNYRNTLGSYRIYPLSILKVDSKIASPTTPKSYDINGDGLVDVMDITDLIGYILTNGGTLSSSRYDLNGNAQVDVADITILVNKILGQ